MTMQQFNQLNEMEKVSAIMKHGRLMAQNVEEDCRTFLYRLDSFYVTACYEKHNDQLQDISCYLEMNQQIPHFRKQLITMDPAERSYSVPNI